MIRKRSIFMWILIVVFVVTGIAFLRPADIQAKTAKYTVSKKAGTYETKVKTRVTAKKGYKVYYATKKKGYNATKYIKPQKSKTFVFKKTTTLRLIAAKKNAKLTTAKLNSKKYSQKEKKYKYVIKKAASEDKPTVILYTNDVHCAIDDNIGYDGLSAYRNDMEAEGNNVLLVDAGDMVQGSSIGTLTKGEAIINIMNEVGYDVAAAGNHDFDYGMDRFFELKEKANFPIISCNLEDVTTEKLVLEPYVMTEAGDKKIAFVGVTTPLTITTSTPKFFENDKGEMIYDFMGGDGGACLYEAVQNTVDEARSKGADYCILLSHLGINRADSPYTSREVIGNTTGIDAVIDGHSHNVVEKEEVKNKDGEDVLLSQTGTKLSSIGKLTISKDGKLNSELVSDYEKKDEKITAIIEAENKKFDNILSQVVGTCDFDMLIADKETGTRLVRKQETNIGDFVADAYRYSTGADIALINGGGLRDSIMAGEITCKSLLAVNPFSNKLCVKKITGQQVLDALEYGVHSVPNEFGGFLQVSGITFDVDLSKDAKVIRNEEGMFEGFGSKERRVSNVKVNGVALDPQKTYSVAAVEYQLMNNGDGYTMFDGEVVDTGDYIEDIKALIDYVESFGGTVPSQYEDANGQGRIRVIK